MDDPWGSPWANDTDDPSKTSKSSSRSPSKSTTLEPPPRAILSTSPPKLASTSSFTSSPWGDDDDAFGDWASPNTASTPNTGLGAGSGWGVWAASEGSAASSQQQLTPIPRDTMLGSASPIAWPGSIATAASPSLSPPKRAADSSSLRQPSPDPWAAEFSLSVQEEVKDKSSPIHGDSINDTWAEAEPSKKDAEGPPEETQSAGTPTVAQEKDAGQDVPEVDDISEGETLDSDSDGERGRPERSKRISGTDHPTDLPTDDGSRSSSPGSDGSHHDERGQDSPITSIDEDSKIRPQLQQRKVSSRVQDLVHMYDDIGRRIVSEDADLAQKAAKSRERSHDSRVRQSSADPGADDDDFGDFGEVEPAEEPVPQPAKIPASEAPDAKARRSVARPSTPHSRTGSIQTPVDTPGSQPSPATQRASASAFQDLLAKYGPVTYTPDLALVTKLFPDLPPLPEQDESERPPPFYVPDHIIDDSFTTVSERKTWYRVSRHGSSRKHDAGADDENYRRITWPVAVVRGDAIKIVRRWMEEDSFTGRATLGGTGSKIKGNVFGWDSSAEPVALDEVFKKKRNSMPAKPRSEFALAAPSGPTNTVVNGQQVGATAQSHHTTAQRPSATVAPSLASFGAPDTHTSQVKGPLSRLVPARPMSMPPNAFKAPPVNAVPHQNGANPGLAPDNEDDDDWGEMIASPQESSFPSNQMSGLSDLKASPQIAKPPLSSFGTGLDEVKSGAPAKAPIFVQDQATTPQPPANNSSAEMDFSIFETPAPAVSQSTSLATNTNTHPISQSQPGFASTDLTPKLPQAQNPSRKDDELVRDIVSRLPNLSYMLR